MVKRQTLVLGNAWLFAAMSIMALPQYGHSLTRGDIIVLGMQTAGDAVGGLGFDSFTFVTLVDLAPGTRIYFTDTGTDGSKFFGVDQNGFTGQEGLGYFEVSTNHLLRAGTIVSTADTSDPFFVWKKVGSDGSITTLSEGQELLDLQSDSLGDQIYAFQSTAALPPDGKPLREANTQYHLSALGTNTSWTWSSNVIGSTTLPLSLNTTQADPFVFRSASQQSGATYFHFNPLGATLRTRTEWHSLFNIAANWSYSASPIFELPTGALPMAGGLSLSWKGGSGAWNGPVANWQDSSGNNTRFLPQDHVTFGGSGGGAVSVDSAGVTASDFTINNSAEVYSFTGGQISGKSLIKSGAGSASVANTVNLASGLAVHEGVLVLSGNNSVPGTSLNGGKIVAGHNAAVGAGRVTFNGGTLAADNNARILANPLTINNVAGNKVAGEYGFALTGGANGTGTLEIAFDSSTEALKVSGADFAPGKIDVHNGSLLLGASNVIGNSTRLQLSGGTFDTGGFSEVLGALALTFDSVLDLGDGSSVLQFANSRTEQWSGILRIDHWSGNLSGLGIDRLLFGNAFTSDLNAGLTAGQTQMIFFRNPEGLDQGLYSAKLLPSGELVPSEVVQAPEPSTIFTVAGGLGLLGMRRFRRRSCSGR